jgi:pyridoxine 4-dehydrogenase
MAPCSSPDRACLVLPKDKAVAIAVLREAIARGVDHIDTSDFYGPHVTNQLIHETLHPYPGDLVIVTKVGAVRGTDASWNPAATPVELTQAVHDNLRNLGLERLEVVNLRWMGDGHGPAEGSIARQFETLADLQRRGLVRHLGLSNVTQAQIAEVRRIADVVCVQNFYNLVHRTDDALIDELAKTDTAYVPFFPLGGFSPLQSAVLSDVATTLDALPIQVALAWLLSRAPNALLIPGTGSLAHLHENLAAADLKLPAEQIARLDSIARDRGLRDDVPGPKGLAASEDAPALRRGRISLRHRGDTNVSSILSRNRPATGQPSIDCCTGRHDWYRRLQQRDTGRRNDNAITIQPTSVNRQGSAG